MAKSRIPETQKSIGIEMINLENLEILKSKKSPTFFEFWKIKNLLLHFSSSLILENH